MFEIISGSPHSSLGAARGSQWQAGAPDNEAEDVEEEEVVQRKSVVYLFVGAGISARPIYPANLHRVPSARKVDARRAFTGRSPCPHKPLAHAPTSILQLPFRTQRPDLILFPEARASQAGQGRPGHR